MAPVPVLNRICPTKRQCNAVKIKTHELQHGMCHVQQLPLWNSPTSLLPLSVCHPGMELSTMPLCMPHGDTWYVPRQDLGYFFFMSKEATNWQVQCWDQGMPSRVLGFVNCGANTIRGYLGTVQYLHRYLRTEYWQMWRYGSNTARHGYGWLCISRQ